MHASNFDFTTDVHTNGQSQYAVSCTLKKYHTTFIFPEHFVSTVLVVATSSGGRITL